MASGIFSGVTVILVEDHENLRAILSEFLIQKGAKVIACSTAAQALEIITQNPPNLVLAAIRMQDGNGIRLLTGIRALGSEFGGKIPVIAMGSLISPTVVERESPGEFNAYLGRPFTPARLLEAIKSALHSAD